MSASALAAVIRPWLDEMPAAKLAEHLIGGIALLDLPKSEMATMLTEAFGGTDFVIPPVPNTLFQRDPSCWIYKGVTCNPMFWPARQPETLLQRAVYKFHPRFKGADFSIWWGDSDETFGAATVEGGDVMPIGKGVVLIGMGERTTRQAVYQLADQLFKQGAATRVDRLPDAEEPCRDAPGHGVQLLRPRPGDRLPRGGRPDPLLQRTRRRQGRHRSASRRRPSVRRGARCARA